LGHKTDGFNIPEHHRCGIFVVSPTNELFELRRSGIFSGDESTKDGCELGNFLGCRIYLLLFILKAVPMTVCSLLKNKTIALAVRHQSVAFGMSDANHAVGHVFSFDVLLENTPNLIYLLA
jgi:hypothetical protein